MRRAACRAAISTPRCRPSKAPATSDAWPHLQSHDRQLKEQRNELISTNQQLDERRRFTEAMLAGVSAGVIGIDPGRADIAGQPLGRSRCWAQGRRICSARPFADALPDFAPVLEQARAALGLGEGQVTMRVGGQRAEFHRARHHREIG